MGHTWTEQLPESIRPALHALKLLGEEGSGPDPDQWDGYPVERATLLRHLRDHEMRNVVVLSGDVHVAIVDELHEDPTAGDDPVAVEFVTSSLTSMNVDDKMGWPRRDERSLAIERTAVDILPHWKWCEFDSNGYMVVDVNREPRPGRVVVRRHRHRAVDARRARRPLARRARQSARHRTQLT